MEKTAKTTPFLQRFFEREETAGLFLLFATALALFWANGPFQSSYLPFWEKHIGLSFAELHIGLSARHFVDDVLMSFFFLLVGCELKRERLEGELASPTQIRLPVFAALGGMIVPALVFVAIQFAVPDITQSYLRGWAIPTATDIAFALGILVLMKSYAPPSLKAFLLALAILDDLGAVVLIGLFYSSSLNLFALAAAGLVMLGLWGLNRRGVRALPPYLALGILLWLAIYQSGLHATLAGVLLAIFLPLRDSGSRPPLKIIEEKLHHLVAFVILPVFALANAGVPVGSVSADRLASPLTLGIFFGLFLGKQTGVLAGSWLCLRLGLAHMPARANWLHLYGLALLCGIGFTMSLFIAALAFEDQQAIMAARLGILGGSAASAIAGCLALRLAGRPVRNV